MQLNMGFCLIVHFIWHRKFWFLKLIDKYRLPKRSANLKGEMEYEKLDHQPLSWWWCYTVHYAAQCNGGFSIFSEFRIYVLDSRCLLVTIADSDRGYVIFWKSRSFFWISQLLAIISSVQFEFIMTHSIFLDLFTFTQQRLQLLQQKTFKWINLNFHEICQYKNYVHQIMFWQKKEAKIFRRNSVISRILHWLD